MLWRPDFDFEDDDILLLASQGRGKTSAPAPFSPLQLPNLRIWIEVNLSCPTLNNNDPITTANDLSGLGNNMGQSVVANKPVFNTNVLNGFPVATFTHTVPTDGHWMTSGYSPANESAPNVTFAAVFATNNPADGEIMLWAGNSAGNGFGPEDEISLSLGDATLGNLIAASYGGVNQGPESSFSPFNSTAFHIGVATFNQMTSDGATKAPTITVDGTGGTNNTGTTTNNYANYEAATFWGKPDASGTITRVWNGQMAALVVCAAALSAAQVTQLTNFWKAKYGL